jgi:D-psicose/D-tagatose/L-ribulose 3-epimerase
MQLCLFAAEPDIAGLGFVVKVLTGSLDELAARAVAFGFDGIEFMPNPDHVPDPAAMERALKAAGAAMPVVNSGRMMVQGYALLDADADLQRRSVAAYKRLIEFAGHFGARIGLGAARGPADPAGAAADVFRELAEYASSRGVVIMLEPADPGVTSSINTVEEAMAWVDRIASPAFSVMLDTYELVESEPSIEHGIRAARGQARHIHLYDPSRWPPGVLERGLDWPRILRLLREEGFEGSGSVVVAPEGDVEAAARKSAAFLRRLLEAES